MAHLSTIRFIIDSGDEIVNGAKAQDAGQASAALDDGVMDRDDHLCSQLDHWTGSPSGRDQFHWQRRYWFRFVFSDRDETVDPGFR